MSTCVRSGCNGEALASWWQLCAACTLPLITISGAAGEQTAAAGWDALAWAERIAPSAWGNAADEEWMLSTRCLTFAAVVTGRSTGCAHTAEAGTAVPVVVLPRMPGVLRCPPCAELLVAQASVAGPSCDRCRTVPVGGLARTAAVAGASLIVVAKLCPSCQATVLPLSVGLDRF